jgi:hypothetical protein
MLTAALALHGDIGGAKATLAEFQRLQPSFVSLAALSTGYTNWDASPEYVELRQKTVDVGLRCAGMPDT